MRKNKDNELTTFLSEIDLRSLLVKIKSECKRVNDTNGSEEDLRIAIELLLRENVWNFLGIPKPKYEHKVEEGVSGQHWGELDALYGLVIFEYKKPGELRKSSIREKAISKMKTAYIPGLLGESNIKQHIQSIIEKGHSPIITGIIWDGYEVIFMDYFTSNKNFRLEPDVGCYQLNESILRRIIRSVIAAFKKKIDARLIAADFGYDSEIVDSKLAVKIFYKKLLKPSERTQKLYDEWAKLTSQALSISGDELRKIAIEYGFQKNEVAKVDGIKLFFAIQTYYTIVIKLISAEVAARFYKAAIKTFLEDIGKAISEGKIKERIEKLESGDIYSSYGIRNFLEGELFSWYLDEWDSEIELIIIAICEKFLEYDIESMIRDPSSTRDVFKLLYEGLVPRKEVRHKIGMYTTPDWLAELIIKDLTKGKRNLFNSRFLDPGAGTGTFLTLVIKKIVDTCGNKIKSNELLEKITANVIGFDIDSLAVLTARANYLIALASSGLLEQKEKEYIEIPIYLANSMITAKELKQTIMHKGKPINVIIINAGGTKYFLPSSLIKESLNILNEFKRFIDAKSPFNNDTLQKILQDYNLNSDEYELLEDVYNNLLDLKERGVDSVWIPIIKTYLVSNYYSNFDFVIGNPPWIAYRYITNLDYQKEIKKLIKDKYNLVTDEKLLTHMEMATLFLIRCIDLYLKDKGLLGFVMPKSIQYSDQHHKFRTLKAKIKYKFDKIFDIMVVPLFNVPTCAIIVKKERLDTKRLPEIPTVFIEGKLPKNKHKTIEFSEASNLLKIVKGKLHLSLLGSRSFFSKTPIKIIAEKGFYFDRFFQGTTLVPQTCWLVDIVDETLPIVTTSKRAKTRGKMKDEIKNQPIEKNYLYKVFTSAEILPFCQFEPNDSVLPIEPATTRYRLLTKDIARIRGKTHLVEWLERAEIIWSKMKGSKKRTLYERINYHNLLINQDPSNKYIVLYLTSATNLASTVIENKSKKIIVESTLYRFYTNNKGEAFYLSAILNSSILNNLIKPLQAKGFAGAARHIHKKPLEFPFPKYNSSNETHKLLSELGEKASQKAKKILPKVMTKRNYNVRIERQGTLVPMEMGSLRSWIREELIEDLARIDEQVKQLFETLSSADLTQFEIFGAKQNSTK